MRKVFYLLITAIIAASALSACSDDATDVNDINGQTVLVYMPWSGNEHGDIGLLEYFQNNLDSIESAISKSRVMPGRVLVFLSTSATESHLEELTYVSGKIAHTPIRTYSGNFYTTAEGIAEILHDVSTHAYALNYAMIIGCHGCGWTFKNDWSNYPAYAKRHHIGSRANTASQLGPTGGYPTTRFYGSVSSTQYATDVTTLAQGIEAAGMKMQYILFDDCYMANIETAYELRHATNYLIGSTSEVMATGMPYQTMWTALASPTPRYADVVSKFNDFYSTFTYPYGALSVIDCRAVEDLAGVMKEINTQFALPGSTRDSIQVLDGFKTPIFYDLADYVEHLCTNTTLLNSFHTQLAKVVKKASTTPTLYSALYTSYPFYEAPVYIKVGKYSGITVSDPSQNTVAEKGKSKTGWWKATH